MNYKDVAGTTEKEEKKHIRALACLSACIPSANLSIAESNNTNNLYLMHYRKQQQHQ